MNPKSIRRNASFPTWLRMVAIMATMIAIGSGLALWTREILSPWNQLVSKIDVILVEDGCQFSEAAAACLGESTNNNETPLALAVATADTGDLYHTSCNTAHEFMASNGGALASLSLFFLPKKLWCSVLAQDAAHWLHEKNGTLQWPAFVHSRQIIGFGLSAEHFRALGIESVAGDLDSCVSRYVASSSL